MASDRAQSRILNLVGVLWLVAALGILGFFVIRDTVVLQELQHNGMRPGPTPVKHLQPAAGSRS